MYVVSVGFYIKDVELRLFNSVCVSGNSFFKSINKINRSRDYSNQYSGEQDLRGRDFSKGVISTNQYGIKAGNQNKMRENPKDFLSKVPPTQTLLSRENRYKVTKGNSNYSKACQLHHHTFQFNTAELVHIERFIECEKDNQVDTKTEDIPKQRFRTLSKPNRSIPYANDIAGHLRMN